MDRYFRIVYVYDNLFSNQKASVISPRLLSAHSRINSDGVNHGLHRSTRIKALRAKLELNQMHRTALAGICF